MLVCMPRILPRQVLAFTVVHLFLVITALFFALEGLAALDDDDWKPSMLGQVAEVVMIVLLQPGMFVWALLGGGRENPDSLEWLVFCANSLVWGVALAFLRAWWLQRSRD